MPYKFKTMKHTKKSAVGTSFHMHTINATVTELLNILGKPTYGNNDGTDKVNFEWVMETDKGTVFTVYDWKAYRALDYDEVLSWHIGGHTGYITLDAQTELLEALSSIRQTTKTN